MRNSADLIEFTRFLIGEKTSRYFRNGHLCSCLSAAQNRVAAMLRKSDSGFFETYEDYTMVADQGNYDLPSFFKSPLKVERIDGNYSAMPQEINHRRQSAPGGRSSFTTWDLKGNEIWFFPVPTSTTPQYRLWYSFYLPDMLYCPLTTGSDVNTLKLSQTADAEDDYRIPIGLDDYYNGVTVEMATGDEVGEPSVVSDYTSATGTLELATDLSGAPSTGEIVASHIQIPEDMWEPLALLAAHLSRARDRDGKYIYGAEFVGSIRVLMPEAQLRLSGMGEVQLYGVDGAI